MEADILTYYEADHFVQDLQEIDIQEYGGPKWRRQHENVYKLNLQSHKHARESHEEFILEQTVTWDKVKTLIYDLVMSAVWKQELLPLLLTHVESMTAGRAYILVANFLEVLLYHRSAVDAAGDYLVDLIEYCYGKIHPLVSPRPPTTEGEILQQIANTEFSLGICSLSILRFITDHLQGVPMSTVQELVEHCDIFCVLVPLMEVKPWIRTTKQGRLIFENQEWQPHSDTAKVSKVEAQIWLTIFNLFMNEDVRRKYDLNSYRKANLLRLRKYLNEVVIDQIPALASLHRALEEMNLMGDSSGSGMSTFAVQQVPELRNRVTANRNWGEIAEYQRSELLVETDDTRREDMELLMQGITYLDDDPICAKCRAPATNRCSKCKSEWYCSRKCQVEDWSVHKQICKVLAETKGKRAAKPSEPTKSSPKIQELSTLD